MSVVTFRSLQRGPDKPYRTPFQWKAQRRIGDLMRIYCDQYPSGLPHNAVGVKYARYMCRTMAFDPVDGRSQWLDRYAAWMDADTRSKILSLGPHGTRHLSLGNHLELYDEDRDRLEAWTVEACDVTPAERKLINLEKERHRSERRRRKNNSVSREEYLATNTASSRQPWKDLKMSRAKFYRLGLHKVSETIPTAPSLINNIAVGPVPLPQKFAKAA
jgi:hypothetical protein